MRAILFDFDGLMVDTETAIYEAWRELYADHGQELPLATYVQCVGSTFGHYDPMAALEELTGGPVEWERVLAKKDARIHELQAGLDTMPGVREVLAEAAGMGVRCAVASSSQRSHVGRWLARTGLEGAFGAVLTRDDVARAKPWPDLFLAASAALGVVPEEALVLEDSHNGLRAAVAAGVPCVVVPSPVTRGLDFGGAAAVLPTLREVSVGQLREIHRGFALARAGKVGE